MTERLKWLHPQLTEDIRWDFLWFGELDMQQRTIPRLYGLAPGVVALTGLSGRGVPTGSMLGGILAEWALDVPENDLSPEDRAVAQGAGLHEHRPADQPSLSPRAGLVANPARRGRTAPANV